MTSPYDYVLSTGVVQADTSDVQNEVICEWQTAFGTDLITTPDTPQGVMIAAEVVARSNVINSNALVANQLNPNLSGGIFLEAICALMGLEREAGTYTYVTAVTQSGAATTVIPAGSQVATIAGDIFQTVSACTIGGGGTVTVDFQAIEAGPIVCLAGQLTQIQPNSAVLGWETSSNSTDGVEGGISQSDAELQLLRLNTLGAQGNGSDEAIVAALYKVPGVTSLAFLSNVGDTSATIEGIVLAAHSVWACVAGGADLDVATALLGAKKGGAGWNGVHYVNVTEPNSGQVYAVQFDRPTAIPVKTIVTLSQGTCAADLTVTAPQAIVDFANGALPGEPGLVVGVNCSPFDFAAAVAEENPGVRVRSVQIALVSGGGYQTTEIAIALNQQATIVALNVSVVIE